MHMRQPRRPVPRFATEMGNRNDENEVGATLVHDAVRKPLRQTAARPMMVTRPCFRLVKDASDAGFHFVGEFVSQTKSAMVIVDNSLLEFCTGFRQKLIDQ